jgi:hypothetical protein
MLTALFALLRLLYIPTILFVLLFYPVIFSLVCFSSFVFFSSRLLSHRLSLPLLSVFVSLSLALSRLSSPRPSFSCHPLSVANQLWTPSPIAKPSAFRPLSTLVGRAAWHSKVTRVCRVPCRELMGREETEFLHSTNKIAYWTQAAQTTLLQETWGMDGGWWMWRFWRVGTRVNEAGNSRNSQ